VLLASLGHILKIRDSAVSIKGPQTLGILDLKPNSSVKAIGKSTGNAIADLISCKGAIDDSESVKCSDAGILAQM